MNQIFFKPLVVSSIDGVAIYDGQFIFDKSTETLYIDWDGARHEVTGGDGEGAMPNFTVSCESGDIASVTINDEEGAKNLHFVLPQGEKGEQGEKGQSQAPRSPNAIFG